MTTTNLTVRFATLFQEHATRTYVGDLGLVPSIGMRLFFGPQGELVVKEVRHVVGSGIVNVRAEPRSFEDIPAAQAFAAAFNTRALALGFTLAP